MNHKPMFMFSQGYSSSEYLLDDFRRQQIKMKEKSNIYNELDDTKDNIYDNNFNLMNKNNSINQDHLDNKSYITNYQKNLKPMIRLETLSSKETKLILLSIYVSFIIALFVPYIQGKGFLQKDITISGDKCENKIFNNMSCTSIFPEKSISIWQTEINNISIYADSISLWLTLDKLKRFSYLNDIKSLNNKFITLSNDYYFIFDIYVHAWRNQNNVKDKDKWFIKKLNQNIWTKCTFNNKWICEPTELIDFSKITQELGKSGFTNYFIRLIYHGDHPLNIAETVNYSFRYNTPVIHIAELICRNILFLLTLLYIPFWYYKIWIYNIETKKYINKWNLSSYHSLSRIQGSIFIFSIFLLLWQNPIYNIIQWYTNIDIIIRFYADTIQVFAESFLYALWLFILENILPPSTTSNYNGSVCLKLTFGIILFIIFESILFLQEKQMMESNISFKKYILLLGFFSLLLIFIWILWIIKLIISMGKRLKKLPYISTRIQQLSYRFYVLQMSLIICYIIYYYFINNSFHLISMYSKIKKTNSSYDIFYNECLRMILSLRSNYQPLGKVLFLCSYLYLLMFIHLPPYNSNHNTSNLYLVNEKDARKKKSIQYSSIFIDLPLFLTNNMIKKPIFCLETANWLIDMSWQAYFDPPGEPSISGYGDLRLEPYGMELIAMLRDVFLDINCLITKTKDNHEKYSKRLVIAFRGSVSKKNWINNLKANQETLWLGKSKKKKFSYNYIGNDSDKSFRNVGEERLSWKKIVSTIPLAKLTLQRVHSGFWKGYKSIRYDLLEMVRLMLNDSPETQVYITGHSMGGAMAILCAYDIGVNLKINVCMYNFGSPRVGNPTFAHHYNKCVPHSYRIVMDGDIVPGIPRFWGMYKHVGTEIAIDVNGNLIVDPSLLEQRLQSSSKRQVHTHQTRIYREALRRCYENSNINETINETE